MRTSNYETFYQLFKEALSRGSDEQFSFVKVTKNNDTSYDGVTLSHSDVAVVPTLSINDCYKKYLAGEAVEDIADEIIEYLTNAPVINVSEVKKILDYSVVADKIVPFVVNTELNKVQLKDMPSTSMLDLSVTYKAVFEFADGCVASTAVTNRFFEEWGITIEELHQTAVNNLRRKYPFYSMKITEVLSEIMEGMGMDKVEFSEEDKLIPFIVLRTKDILNGATAFLLPEEFDKVMDKYDFVSDKLIIIPSSISELLLLEYKSNMNLRNLRNIINEVNTKGVREQEILSYEVYCYNRTSRQISIVDVDGDNL